MPEPIEKSVMRQNIKFMHNRNQFSQEYFHFMKRLSICNTPGQSQYAFEALSVRQVWRFWISYYQAEDFESVFIRVFFFSEFYPRRTITADCIADFQIFISYWISYEKGSSRARFWVVRGVIVSFKKLSVCEKVVCLQYSAPASA